MFISKKRWNAIEYRLAALEGKSTAVTFNYGEVTLTKLARIVEDETRTRRMLTADNHREEEGA